ncbi:hypothetical protein Vadar_003840 [Vaccinium darrowii]|uniref:Uncharacterized protein n=1 Tax=Vaccinium darrowii TaxID=229202 RepID=A0ACB7Y5G7_9ERIC|nr:hypothetical protein Vadar_003840 [Vaccinium darrowii]
MSTMASDVKSNGEEVRTSNPSVEIGAISSILSNGYGFHSTNGTKDKPLKLKIFIRYDPRGGLAYEVEQSLLVTGIGYEHDDAWATNIELFKEFTDISWNNKLENVNGISLVMQRAQKDIHTN